MKKLAIGIAAALTVALLLFWINRPKPIPVTVATVEKGVVESIIANTRAGTIKACRRSKLSLEMGGQVAELMVKEGDRVKAGDILIRLENSDKVAALAQAEATIKTTAIQKEAACAQAQHDAKEYKRLKGLKERKLASEESLDAASIKLVTSRAQCERSKAELEVANANVDIQRALLKKTLLTAPFAGIVAEINGEVGEYVTPSPPGVATPPAVDLIDDSCLYVSAPIDEVDAAKVAIGQKARITLDAFRGRSFPGEVIRIAPYVLDLEKQARTVDVDVRFTESDKNPTLLVGYSADIEVILQQKNNALRIPSETIINGNQVYKVEADTAQLANIEKSLENWNYTEITSGLSEHDHIILSLDAPGLEDGVAVKVEPAQ